MRQCFEMRCQLNGRGACQRLGHSRQSHFTTHISHTQNVPVKDFGHIGTDGTPEVLAVSDWLVTPRFHFLAEKRMHSWAVSDWPWRSGCTLSQAVNDWPVMRCVSLSSLLAIFADTASLFPISFRNLEAAAPTPKHIYYSSMQYTASCRLQYDGMPTWIIGSHQAHRIQRVADHVLNLIEISLAQRCSRL